MVFENTTSLIQYPAPDSGAESEAVVHCLQKLKDWGVSSGATQPLSVTPA